jgi:hypothetical protein
MTLAQALHLIRKHWQALPHTSKAGHDAVWIRLPPTDELVEEEWVGIESTGTVVWAYASGCAAAHRPQETASDTEITVLQCDRKDITTVVASRHYTVCGYMLTRCGCLPVLKISHAAAVGTGSRCTR